MANRKVLFAVALSASLGVTASPTTGFAQGDQTEAKKLFEEGLKLLGEGRVDEACPKLEQSQELRPGVGTLFNLADCNEQRGMLATAHGQFLDVAEQTALAGQADREKVARERATALETQVARITLQPPEGQQMAGLSVSIDGQPLSSSRLASPVAVEPGSHRLTVTDESGVTGDTTFEAGAAGSLTTVVLPKPGTAAPAGGEVPDQVPAVPTEPEGERNTGQIVAGSILMGVGLIALAGGIGAFANAGNLSGDDQRNAVIIGAVATPIGAAGLGVGIPLFIAGLTKDPPQSASNAPRLEGFVGPTSASMRLTF